MDRNCHGLIEWCTLHSNRKEFEGLCWIRPKLSFYDQVFISQDHRFLSNLKNIRKLLPEKKVELFLFKGLHSEKDFKEAQNIFEGVHWVEFEEGEIAV